MDTMKMSQNGTVANGMDGLDRLGKALADVAMRAAVEYLHGHGLTADAGALSACIRAWAKIKLDEAIRDGRAALDAGLGEGIAWQTMAATMALAGIEAAREAGLPAGAR